VSKLSEYAFASPLFSLGTVGITNEANEELCREHTAQEIARGLRGILNRHRCGDWGDIDAHDVKVNEAALKTGARIMSVYRLFGVKLYVITDATWDNPRLREVTTILLPSDY